jgi:hypothetical protein
MSTPNITTYALGAVVGSAMLAFCSGPVSAFTLPGPSMEQSAASAQIDKVWYRYGYGYRGYGWRGYGWRGYGYRGYGGGCWRGYYGRLHCY